MKFAWPNADLSKIIKCFSNEGCVFHVEYLDGTKSDYFCSDPEHIKEIKKQMLEQAWQRQKEMDTKDYDLGKLMLLYSEVVLGLGAYTGFKNEQEFMAFLCTLLCAFNLLVITHGIQVKKELEKFKLFFEMYEHLDEVNKSEFLKTIEFETIYQKQLDIDTIDQFSLGDVKILHRKLEEKYNLSSKN